MESPRTAFRFAREQAVAFIEMAEAAPYAKGTQNTGKRSPSCLNLVRNVLALEDGNLMPFDVVIVRPSQSLKSRLRL
jgi:hypothetical protein